MMDFNHETVRDIVFKKTTSDDKFQVTVTYINGISKEITVKALDIYEVFGILHKLQGKGVYK